jgi:hypothetical protein
MPAGKLPFMSGTRISTVGTGAIRFRLNITGGFFGILHVDIATTLKSGSYSCTLARFGAGAEGFVVFVTHRFNPRFWRISFTRDLAALLASS